MMLISFKFLPIVPVLSSNKIFHLVSSRFDEATTDKINSLIFIEHRNTHFDKPDYVHKNNLIEINNIKTIRELILYSFDKLDEFFYWKNNSIYIKDEYYYDWQVLVTNMPNLSLLVYKLSKDSKQINNINNMINQLFNSSTLPSIYNPLIEDIFKNEKLSDLHMHLTGTTETEYIWEDALASPHKFFSEIKETFNNNQVAELYKQQDISFTPKKIFKILQKAKVVRHYLSQILLKDMQINENLDWTSFLNIDYINTNFEYIKTIPTYGHPYTHKHTFSAFLGYEARFLFDCFNYIQNNNSLIFTKLFYYYISAKSVFHKTVVHQTNQYGFDQFEKITVNQIRELSEKKYLNRFSQLKGMYKQDLEYVEGRFAPKDSKIKNKKLVDRIIKDYEDFCKIERKNHSAHPKLSLVGHFIKKPDNRHSKDIYTYRDYPLRVDLDNRAKLLLDLFKSHPKYTYYIRGIDAAGNELYARPEVFAPSFRYLTKRVNLLPTDYYLNEDSYLMNKKTKSKMKKYFSKKPELGITFHAGEDFIHLISGIRMVYEAVEFLDMPPGSRIGHATALGIDPKHWIHCIGNNLRISRGEWLDNLIFISFFMEDNKELRHLNFEIKDSIDRYWYEVYNEMPSTLHNLKQAFLCRKLDPNTIRNKVANKIYSIDNEEWDQEKILGFKPSKKALELFKEYHDSKYLEKYKEIIEIQVENKWLKLIFNLQQKMIKLLNKKHIAIETMPTSNIRISFYENYEQHHIFNWYAPNEYSGKLKPNLVIASDDPGIFSNHLRAEFSHLYQAAIKKGATQQQTIDWLKELNHNAKIFRF